MPESQSVQVSKARRHYLVQTAVCEADMIEMITFRRGWREQTTFATPLTNIQFDSVNLQD